MWIRGPNNFGMISIANPVRLGAFISRPRRNISIDNFSTVMGGSAWFNWPLDVCVRSMVDADNSDSGAVLSRSI